MVEHPVDGPKPSMVHFDEVDLISEVGIDLEPGEDSEPKQWGDDRAPKYNWTPEQLEKADPTPPDTDLEMPDYVLKLLDEREKLAGRDPLIDEDGESLMEEGMT